MKYIIKRNNKKNQIQIFLAGKCGGRSNKWIIKAECYAYKGYWIIFSRYNAKIYRIWTASLNKSEFNGWVEWLLNQRNYTPDVNIIPVGLRKKAVYLNGILKYDNIQLAWSPPQFIIESYTETTTSPN